MNFQIDLTPKGLEHLMQTILNRRNFISKMVVAPESYGISVKGNMKPDIDFFQSEEVDTLRVYGLQINNCHYYPDRQEVSFMIGVIKK